MTLRYKEVHQKLGFWRLLVGGLVLVLGERRKPGICTVFDKSPQGF